MFTTEELKNIDRTYFHIIEAGSHCVTLQSKNTDLYWHIIHQQYPSFASCKILHRQAETCNDFTPSVYDICNREF